MITTFLQLHSEAPGWTRRLLTLPFAHLGQLRCGFEKRIPEYEYKIQ